MAFALPKNIAGLERDLKKYRIVYDNWFRESTLHQNGQVKWVVEELTKRGYTYEQEGAVWFKATDFGADRPPRLCASSESGTDSTGRRRKPFGCGTDADGHAHA